MDESPDDPAFRVRLIGYWRSESEPHWPDPRALVDPTWDPAERERVAGYLTNGLRAPWACAGTSFCRICGRPVGSRELLDGTYLWPEGLAHYVRDHSVRLPRAFLDRVARWGRPESWAIDETWWQREA